MNGTEGNMTGTEDKVNMKVLVIDDEKSTRDVLVEFLTTLDFPAVAKDTGEEGIKEVRKNPYDLVITDLFLPGMHGLDVVREIKTIAPDTIVIVITGHGSIQTAIESMREGAYDYLTKPFSIETLNARIMKAIEYRKLLQDSEEYKKRATIDALTGLHNYAYFQEVLQAEIERSKRYHYPVSLLMVDLDDLKVYNDTFGHIAGNRILMKIGNIFSSFVRKADIASRYGGEEFAIILPHTEKRYALFLCDRLRSIIEETSFEGEEVMPGGKITISSGVATFPHDASNVEELVDKADKALYTAKKSGKNKVCLYSE